MLIRLSIIIASICIFIILYGCDKSSESEENISEEEIVNQLEILIKKRDQEYEMIINDPNLFQEERKKRLEYSKKWATVLLNYYDYDSFDNGNDVKIALTSALNSMIDNSIEDGAPRMAFAYAEKGVLEIKWFESDFDTSAIVISSEKGTAKHVPFNKTDYKKLVWLDYYRQLIGDFSIVDINENDKLKIITTDFPLEDTTSFYFTLPAGKNWVVWIEDKAGNISNKVPLLYGEN